MANGSLIEEMNTENTTAVREYWQYYSRQIAALGAEKQKHLQQHCVVIVGLGGLGCHILQTLMTIGLGKLVLIDGDKVAYHNLHRQPVFTLADVGQYKAACTRRYVEARTPYTTVEAVETFLDEQNAQVLLENASLILDCSDSFACTSLLNRISIEKGIAMVAASVEQDRGYIGVFSGGLEQKPCYRCLFPELPDNSPVCAEIGVDPRVVSLAATLQADLACAELFEPASMIGQIFTVDCKHIRVSKSALGKNPDCPVCSNHRQTPYPPTDNTTTALRFVESANAIGTLIDVRTAREYQERPRENAINIPLQQLLDNPEQLPKSSLVFCCQTGKRSLTAAHFLLDINWVYDVYVLKQ